MEFKTRVPDVYDKSEIMPREERQKYLDGRLRELVAYAYEKAPAIKARFDKAGIVPSAVYSIKDLENLPILRKDELVELYKAGRVIQGQSPFWWPGDRSHRRFGKSLCLPGPHLRPPSPE